MRYNLIRRMDISNGPGVRISLFTQGCRRHCPGCFNPETWDITGGKEFTEKEHNLILELLNNEYVDGLSVLGGEPLLPENLPTLKKLFVDIFKKYPNKTIWLWTGYTFPELTPEQLELLNWCNVVIEGPFEQDKKDLNLYYAGSSNQRLMEHIGGGFIQKEMPRKN